MKIETYERTRKLLILRNVVDQLQIVSAILLASKLIMRNGYELINAIRQVLCLISDMALPRNQT